MSAASPAISRWVSSRVKSTQAPQLGLKPVLVLVENPVTGKAAPAPGGLAGRLEEFGHLVPQCLHERPQIWNEFSRAEQADVDLARVRDDRDVEPGAVEDRPERVH